MPLSGYYHNELERVDKASKRLREVMDGLSSAFFIGMLTVEGSLTYANRTALESLGLERKDVLGRKFDETPWWAYSEQQREQLRKAVHKATQRESSRFDMTFQDITGKYRIIDFTLCPVFDVKGNVSYLVPSGHDVTERRRAERALAMINECQQLLLRVDDEIRLLQNICQLLVGSGGYDLVWVGYAHYDEEKSIQPMAYAGQALPFTGYLSWSADNERGQGPSGECIRTGQTIICKDIQDSPQISATLQNMASKKGLSGGIVLPLKNQSGVTFALLAIASQQVFNVVDEEVRLLENLADNLAYGIRSLRAQQESQKVLSAIYRIADVVSLATGKSFYQKLMLATTQTLGAQVGFISRLSLANPLFSKTVAIVVDGQLVDNMEIAIENTPCADLDELHKEWIVSSQVTTHYPLAEGLKAFNAEAYIGRRIDNSLGRHVGQMVLLFRQPLQPENIAFISSVFKIFASRVAAEFERQMPEDDHVYKI